MSMSMGERVCEVGGQEGMGPERTLKEERNAVCSNEFIPVPSSLPCRITDTTRPRRSFQRQSQS